MWVFSLWWLQILFCTMIANINERPNLQIFFCMVIKILLCTYRVTQKNAISECCWSHSALAQSQVTGNPCVWKLIWGRGAQIGYCYTWKVPVSIIDSLTKAFFVMIWGHELGNEKTASNQLRYIFLFCCIMNWIAINKVIKYNEYYMR